MNEKQQKLLIKMLEATQGGGVQPDELKQVVDFILEIIKEIKLKIDKDISDDKSEMTKEMEDMNKCMSDMQDMMKEHQKDCKDFTLEKTQKIVDDLMGKIKDIKDNIPSMPDLSVYEAKLEQIKASIPVIKDTILDTPEQIRDKLESLKNEDRLDKSAIRGLQEEIDRLRKEINDSRRTGGTTIFGGVKTRFIDDETLSGTIDGANKIFTISKNPVTGSLKVFRGGARQRVTEDYTFDSNKTITFTIAPVVGEVLLADYRY